MTHRSSLLLLALVVTLLVILPGLADLPPVPVPPENPITEAKRVLGKILFWDEHLSYDRTIACGTCHQSHSAGADPRPGVHPGFDELFGTLDDIVGSPGVARADEHEQAKEDPLFGFDVQVTGRAANVAIGAAFAPELFWDGRAGETFLDPQTQEVSIAAGGALENQAVGPILSDVEMANENRTWEEVADLLGRSVPLQDATDLPADVAAVLVGEPSYADLFEAAFGDPTITAERIGFAIATYERTLVADQTPWDAFVAGNNTALTPNQQNGWNLFIGSACAVCHAPPEFTDHSFRNIGIRPPQQDLGRQGVTGLVQDRGKFKVPTLRNAGLKKDFMHTGDLPTVNAAAAWYRPLNPARSPDNLDPLLPVAFGGKGAALADVANFIQNGLTDPRVAAQQFPFDRPTLHAGALPLLSFGADKSTLAWPDLVGVQSYNFYRGDLADLDDRNGDGLPDGGYGQCRNLTDPDNTDTIFVDAELPDSGAGYFYLKSVVDAQQERGLGATGNGLQRNVGPAACP